MLFPLTLEELIAIQAGIPFEDCRGYCVAPGVISDPVRQANEVKITKMRLIDTKEHPWHTYWFMALVSEKTGIGLAGFKGVPNAHGEVEIGYGIAPAYEGQGYTTEAVKALVQWAFLQPGCGCVVAETLPNNLGSMRVLEKNRFHPYGKRDAFILWRLEQKG